MNIDSVQIECFLSAAKHLNFSKAAAFLYISQPVLSRRISKLEEELGFRLFIRCGKGLLLTQEGEILKEFFEKNGSDIPIFCTFAPRMEYIAPSDR